MSEFRSFLLRCWQEAGVDNGKPAWRYTLILLDKEETQRGFARLDDLMAFLRSELEQTNEAVVHGSD